MDKFLKSIINSDPLLEDFDFYENLGKGPEPKTQGFGIKESRTIFNDKRFSFEFRGITFSRIFDKNGTDLSNGRVTISGNFSLEKGIDFDNNHTLGVLEEEEFFPQLSEIMEFDCEHSCFFAYSKSKESIMVLVNWVYPELNSELSSAIDSELGRLLTFDNDEIYKQVTLNNK